MRSRERNRSSVVPALLLPITMLISGGSMIAQDNDTGPGEFHPRVLMDPIRPIVGAPVLKASEVKDEVRDNELVIGVAVNGEARAYPVNMLTGPMREIINDKLGGRSIAATW